MELYHRFLSAALCSGLVRNEKTFVYFLRLPYALVIPQIYNQVSDANGEKEGTHGRTISDCK